MHSCNYSRCFPVFFLRNVFSCLNYTNLMFIEIEAKDTQRWIKFHTYTYTSRAISTMPGSTWRNKRLMCTYRPFQVHITVAGKLQTRPCYTSSSLQHRVTTFKRDMATAYRSCSSSRRQCLVQVFHTRVAK